MDPGPLSRPPSAPPKKGSDPPSTPSDSTIAPSRKPERPTTRRFIDPNFNEAVGSDTDQFCRLVGERFKCVPRQWQRHAIQIVKAGHDVFIKAGTGSGKSLPFQAMALLNELAIVLVVCPTVALMHDQVHISVVSC